MATVTGNNVTKQKDGRAVNELNPLFDAGTTAATTGKYRDDPDANNDDNWNDEEEAAREENEEDVIYTTINDERRPWWVAPVVVGLTAAVIFLFVLFFLRQGKQVYPYEFVKPSDQAMEDWTPLGGLRYREYLTGESPYLITEDIRQKSDSLARLRRTHVKAAMQFAWKGYTTYAFGMDEVKPVSKVGDNIWKGLATTMVDALDTLWLLNMTEEFWRARDFVGTNLTYSDKDVSVICFETTIRSLGGMLSAYSWSGDIVFLDRAKQIAKRIARSFDHATTGIPFGRVNLMTGETFNDHHEDYTPLSWVGTLQLEFRWLDALVQSNETAQMRQKVENVVTILHGLDPPHGLYPTLVRNVNVSQAEFANQHLTFGANGDSFYEYLLKAWIQGGRKEDVYRNMYDKAVQGLHNVLLQHSTPSGLTFLADIIDGYTVDKLHHLTCFTGGLLALGAYTDPLGMDSKRAQRDLKTAKALTYTCYQMYAQQNTGLSPEEVEFIPGQDFRLEGEVDIHPEGDKSAYGTRPDDDTTSSQNILRPEVVESFYTLYAITKDPIYREWGWEVFQAIETYCKTEIAYGEFPNVANVTASPRDKMESFFLAETVKYLYLLFDPESPVDILTTHVFNTEAHPLPVFDKLK